MNGPQFRHPEMSCPSCESKLGGAFGIGNVETSLATNGVVLCAHCLTFSFYQNGTLRRPTPHEQIGMMNDMQILDSLHQGLVMKAKIIELRADLAKSVGGAN